MSTTEPAAPRQLSIPGLEYFGTPAHKETLRRLRIDQNRADILDLMYEVDGRNDPSHPQHHTYTGLWEETCLAYGRQELQLLWNLASPLSLRPGLDRVLAPLLAEQGGASA